VHSSHHRAVPKPTSHYASPTTTTTALLQAATTDSDSSDESSTPIDPLDVLLQHDSIASTTTTSSWGLGDDWSTLSSDNEAATTMPTASSSASSSSAENGSFDVMDEAARILEEQEKMMSEWDTTTATASASASSVEGTNLNDSTHVKTSAEEYDDEYFVENAVDMISSHTDYNDPADMKLYDTVKMASTSSSSTTKEEKQQSSSSMVDQEEEIAFMIRCNQSPQQLLVSQGRAMPELTDREKYNPEFLLERTTTSSATAAAVTASAGGDDPIILPLQPKATEYLERAVDKMFNAHSIDDHANNEKVLDRKALSKWMTKCVSSPLKPSESYVIGPYDGSISATLSRYSTSHGSGRLTLSEFRALYLEVTWSGYVHSIIHRENADAGGEGQQHHPIIPSSAARAGVLFAGKPNTEKMLKGATLSLVWRDLEAHEIFSPAEEERVSTMMEMERLRAETTMITTNNDPLLLDECELFDDYEERLSHRVAHNDNDDDSLGTEGAWDFLARKEKSSHESVEMARDGKTPKRIRDGQFVFIDEESCIGCTQCAQIAPSTFKMIEDTGRARTYSQSNSLDVESAVMACPVACMHSMSFDELKEMETSRDDGDGRTDHRHFGGSITHTPVHVAGRGSDANHKSSWYHYLKGKCHGSHSCPQRGCYDCPTYAPGENPLFKARHRQAELIRAKDFMDSGEADKWRKVMEL